MKLIEFNRAKALAYIDRVATDGDLLRLTATLRHWKSVEENETKKLAGETAPDSKSFFMEHHEEVEKHEATTAGGGPDVSPMESPRTNVSPGPSSITKIGSKTREEILQSLKEGRQPSDKYSEHMKLLWSRDEVKFDGEKYYAID